MKKKIRLLACIFFLLGLFLIGGSIIYQYEVSPINQKDHQEIEVVIPSGTSMVEIANILKEKGFIHHSLFFKIYVKLNHINNMKASTYKLKRSMSLDEIVSLLQGGNSYNKDAIQITFQEGKTIEHYASQLEKETNIQKEDFLAKMKDTAFLGDLIKKYWFLTDTILQSDIYYGLEGYLAPDTYEFKNKQVTSEEIITTLLDQEEEILKPYQKILTEENVHRILTLASLAELEGVREEDRKQIVGVFQNRLSAGMNLGSDVTTYYAFHQEMTGDLTTAMFNTYNPYNTRSVEMNGKLPIGPICNPSKSSIEAAMNPAKTDALYFVADKNGKIYYTKTAEEHNKTVKEIKEKGDWIW